MQGALPEDLKMSYAGMAKKLKRPDSDVPREPG
jgi:hypothetical protein